MCKAIPMLEAKARDLFRETGGDMQDYLVGMAYDIAQPRRSITTLDPVMAAVPNIAPPPHIKSIFAAAPVAPPDHGAAYAVAAAGGAVALATLVPATALAYRQKGSGLVTLAGAVIAVALAIAMVVMTVHRESTTDRVSQRLSVTGLAFCAAALVSAAIVAAQLRSRSVHPETPYLMLATVLLLVVGGSTLAGSTAGLGS